VRYDRTADGRIELARERQQDRFDALPDRPSHPALAERAACDTQILPARQQTRETRHDGSPPRRSVRALDGRIRTAAHSIRGRSRLSTSSAKKKLARQCHTLLFPARREDARWKITATAETTVAAIARVIIAHATRAASVV